METNTQKNTDKKVKLSNKHAEKLAARLKVQAEFAAAKEKEVAAKKLLSKRPGIIATIHAIVSAATKPAFAVSQKQIVDKLVAKFPNHKRDSMAKTVKTQLNISRTAGTSRMEREKNVIFDTVVKGLDLYYWFEA